MDKIELFSVGELKFKELEKIEKRYFKKINYLVEFSMKNLKEAKLSDEKLVKKKEAEMMLSLIKTKDYVIALDRQGKKMDSLTFSKFLADKISYHSGRIIFLIGGYCGLSELLDARINFKISFSDLTFSHDLFRMVFLEQLYRALTIMKGIKYHR